MIPLLVALLLLVGGSAYAQVTIEPDSPTQLRAYVANTAPDNPALRTLHHSHVLNAPGVSLSALRTITARWTTEDPGAMQPYFVLGRRLAELPDGAAEPNE